MQGAIRSLPGGFPEQECNITFATGRDFSATDHPERRRHLRCKVSIQLELRPHGADAPFRTTTSDISTGGCYVETRFTLAAGTTLAMTLWLEGVMLTTTGIVTTCDPQVGNGIEFTSIMDKDAQILEQFLAQHAVADEE